MKFSIASDQTAQAATAATAVAAGGATWLTMAKDLALELLGVPLPVVLACATAAFGALSFVSAMPYRKTLFAGVIWTLVGTYGAQFALHLLAKVFGLELSSGALAGAGMIVSGLGPMVVTMDNVQKLRAAIGRKIDGTGGGGT
jgi:hypothetical protein